MRNKIKLKDPKTEIIAKREWTIEEMWQLVMLYINYGSCWNKLSVLFPGRTGNDLKNKFYGMLKQVATRTKIANPKLWDKDFTKSKSSLLPFLQDLLKSLDDLSPKKGRKNKKEIMNYTQGKTSEPNYRVENESSEGNLTMNGQMIIGINLGNITPYNFPILYVPAFVSTDSNQINSENQDLLRENQSFQQAYDASIN